MDNRLKERGYAPKVWAEFQQSMSASRQQDLKRFYQAGFGYMDQKLNDAPCLAIDIETTGLNPEQDKIVSVGLVEFDSSRVYLKTAKHWLVNPGELSDTSIVVHGITHSDVSSAPTIDSIMPELLDAMAGRLCVVHYRAMEREFFRKLGFALWSQPWLFPVIDTFALEASCLTHSQRWFNRLLGKPLPSLRLPDTRIRYHLPEYENHNALVDAIATAELLQAQMQKWRLGDRCVKELCQ
ncbi:exonuclease domain-containing protein [Thalassolituus oleivorans]|uniref:exonuclease domain-containing protein n=1 Tax=Thalassolituus oleivorans TaxID=187493 RepID=UPI00240A1679|nr:exonuclease domain-containing protein [Thalassolituus oleivorans]MDF1642001.1 exonuclease domain-containing protein [Thalassolituus oleivorans]